MANIPAHSISTTLADKSPKPETTVSDPAQEYMLLLPYHFIWYSIQDHKDYNCLCWDEIFNAVHIKFIKLWAMKKHLVCKEMSIIFIFILEATTKMKLFN